MKVGLPVVGIREEMALKLLHRSSRPENVTDHFGVIWKIPSAKTPSDCCVPPLERFAVCLPDEYVISSLKPVTSMPSRPTSMVKRLANCFDHCAIRPICCTGTRCTFVKDSLLRLAAMEENVW